MNNNYIKSNSVAIRYITLTKTKPYFSIKKKNLYSFIINELILKIIRLIFLRRSYIIKIIKLSTTLLNNIYIF